MPEIRIEAGADPEKIIPELQAGQEFNLAHTGGGKVHLDHNKRDVTNDPQRVSTVGDEGPIRSPDVADIWAYAPDTDATLRVSPKGFIWDLFSNKATERPTDRAGRNLTVDQSDTLFENVNSGSSDTDTVLGSTDGELRLYQIIMRVESAGNEWDRVSVSAIPRDSSGTVTGDIVAGPVTNSPLQCDPFLTVPDGGDLQFLVDNYSSTVADVIVGARYEVA